MTLLFINNNSGSYAEDLKVTLNGESYTLNIWFSDSTKSYNISISNTEGVLIENLRLTENTVVTFKHDIVGFEGDIALVKMTNTPEAPNRDNVGVGKDYTILYLLED